MSDIDLLALIINVYDNKFLRLKLANSWVWKSVLSKRYQGLFSRGKSGRCMKLTTQLHLMSRSKNVRSCTSTPQIRLHGVVLF